jgi:GMP synthase-like glutamine amidotransferase
MEHTKLTGIIARRLNAISVRAALSVYHESEEKPQQLLWEAAGILEGGENSGVYNLGTRSRFAARYILGV